LDGVSPDTWTLINQRELLKRLGTHTEENKMTLRDVNNGKQKHIRHDCKLQTMQTGSEIKDMLEIKDILGAWNRIKRWYLYVSVGYIQLEKQKLP
jgi:hypothetical protein